MDMAEIELSILSHQALAKHDEDSFSKTARAWTIHYRKQRQHIPCVLRIADGFFGKILRIAMQPFLFMNDKFVKRFLILDGYAHYF